ncbi:MAG: hypothetical protein QF402_16855, partial [Candidatus Latescibacteria bacterium]|nr:hypothetical protein [Candidatus Latescibacterota bacterium]
YRYKALSCPHEDASTMLRASEWTNTRVSPTLSVAVISSLLIEKTKVSAQIAYRETIAGPSLI